MPPTQSPDNHLIRSITDLIAEVPGNHFGVAVLRFLSMRTRIANFGVFYFPDISSPKPVLSVWSGRISDYWYKRNAKDVLGNADLQAQIVAQLKAAPRDGVHIERWHPEDGDPRKQMYKRAGLIERISVASRDGRSGYQSFFLRAKSDGWFSDEEYADLTELLPAVHRLIGLRHQIVGSENFQFTARTSPSNLHERNVAGFATLSPREVQICDQLVEGKTAAETAIDLGISEATVRTLRQRAYQKLGVGSATELMALMVNDTSRD